MNKPIKSNDLDALDAAFAEKVAGWYLSRNGESLDYVCYRSEADYFAQPLSGTWPLPKFTRSADAVLPWLERGLAEARHTHDDRWSGRKWTVYVLNGYSSGSGISHSFPHAAVIALLRAHGVEVIDDE